MEKISKKEVRKVVADLIESSLLKLKLANPSDRTKKELSKLSKKVSSLIQDEIKKQEKLAKKALKAVNEKKLIKEKKKAKGKQAVVDGTPISK